MGIERYTLDEPYLHACSRIESHLHNARAYSFAGERNHLTDTFDGGLGSNGLVSFEFLLPDYDRQLVTEDRSVAAELPHRVLVTDNGDDTTMVVYRSPETIADEYDLGDDVSEAVSQLPALFEKLATGENQ